MSGFPVNLDLSEYFDDLRKYSSVFVNVSKCKEVGDVENHIKSVFRLEDNICLVHKKFLIPKSEDIQILQQYDIFKVQKCNFYDLQIHKTKKVNTNTTCDQKALNLTQSEKTIDLSCRPKQRLKANTSPSPGISGTLTFQVDNSKRLDSQIMSSAHDTLLDRNQTVSKEKQKHRKKRHLHKDDSDDDADTDGNILDMSVKNSKRKKHTNCFSTDDGSLKSERADDNDFQDVSKDFQKKFKKRKKHSENLDESSLDLVSTCWDSLACDMNVSKDQNSRKKSKKVREDCFNGGSSTDTNTGGGKNELKNPVELYDTFPVDNECSSRKKHKHSKKSQENQYYSSSPTCTSKNHSPKKSSILKTIYDIKHDKDSESRKVEQQKKRIEANIDQMILQVQKNNNSDTSSQTNGDYEESTVSSIKQPRSDSSHQEERGSVLGENNIQESFPDCANPKRRRKRKHNKKKKRDLLYMHAVGPALSQLAKSAISTSAPGSETAKHVYFTEDDFEEDMKIPVTPPVKAQTIQDPTEPLRSNAEVVPIQEQSTSKPASWQDQLLKLASADSKPVVFHRNTVPSTAVKPVSTSQLQEYLKPNSSTEKSVLSSNQADNNSPDVQHGDVNHLEEDFRRCNGDVKTENNEGQSSYSGTVSGSCSRKGLPDICRPLPIPNDLDKINLTDYPIIDNVVPEDLILFKVLKMNENSEPGVSKPILARVNGMSNFPERISLQIMEGCEECSHCAQSEGTGEAFIIELRWTDILEPRLFYP